MVKLPRQTVNEVYAERDQLKAINADLLAALENIVNFATMNEDGDYVIDCDLRTDSMGKARAAIAKAPNTED